MSDTITLVEARKSLGLSQTEMAERVGLKSKGFYSRVEQGLETPSIRVALAIERETDGAVKAHDLNPQVGLVREHDRRVEAA